MSAAALLDDPLLSVMVRLVIGGVLERDDGREWPRVAPGAPVVVPGRVDLIGAAHDAARVEVGAAVLGVPRRFDLIAALGATEELLAAVRAALRPGGTFVAVEDATSLLDRRALAASGFRDVAVATVDGGSSHRYYVAR